MLKTLLLGSLSIAILLLSNGSSGAADLQWTDVLEKCDKIYNTRQKNMPLDVFVTLTGAYEHKGGDGVRYFSSKEGQNKWKGMDLIAAYGVDDCSDASLAFDTQCYPVHPPNVTFIFKTTLAVKIGMSKAGVFAKHLTEPLDESIFGVTWYENFPETLIDQIRSNMNSENNL